MTKSGKHKRLALRFAAYIQAIGAIPVTTEHNNYRKHAKALQQQYQRLIVEYGRERVNQARLAARAEINKVTLQVAAHGLVPEIPPTPPKSHNKKLQVTKTVKRLPISLTSALPARPPEIVIFQNSGSASPRSKDIRNCRHKIAHFDYLSALHHARRLTIRSGEAPINIYPCLVCGGLHVGHVPKGHGWSESLGGC